MCVHHSGACLEAALSMHTAGKADRSRALSGVKLEHAAHEASQACWVPTLAAHSSWGRVWAAEMQMRALAVSRGVAGKPTTTTAMPRSKHRREKAAILEGSNSMMGCRGKPQTVSHLAAHQQQDCPVLVKRWLVGVACRLCCEGITLLSHRCQGLLKLQHRHCVEVVVVGNVDICAAPSASTTA